MLGMNKAFKKSKFIIANSNYTKNLAVKVGLESNKIHIINPGTDYPIEIEKTEELNAKKYLIMLSQKLLLLRD